MLFKGGSQKWLSKQKCMHYIEKLPFMVIFYIIYSLKQECKDYIENYHL